MKLMLALSIFVIFAAMQMVSCMPSKRVVMVWRHMLPEVADNKISKVENRGKIGKKFIQQQQLLETNHSDAIIISPLRRIRRDVAQQQQKINGDGKTRFFKLCVTVKNGKCIRKKLFGMWNASRGNPSTKILT